MYRNLRLWSTGVMLVALAGPVPFAAGQESIALPKGASSFETTTTGCPQKIVVNVPAPEVVVSQTSGHCLPRLFGGHRHQQHGVAPIFLQPQALSVVAPAPMMSQFSVAPMYAAPVSTFAMPMSAMQTVPMSSAFVSPMTMPMAPSSYAIAQPTAFAAPAPLSYAAPQAVTVNAAAANCPDPLNELAAIKARILELDARASTAIEARIKTLSAQMATISALTAPKGAPAAAAQSAQSYEELVNRVNVLTQRVNELVELENSRRPKKD